MLGKHSLNCSFVGQDQCNPAQSHDWCLPLSLEQHLAISGQSRAQPAANGCLQCKAQTLLTVLLSHASFVQDKPARKKKKPAPRPVLPPALPKSGMLPMLGMGQVRCACFGRSC